MRNRIILGILVVVLVLSGFAFAQEEVQLLEEAKTLLAEGKFAEAQVTLEAVRLSLWNKLPMRIEKVTFVEEELGYSPTDMDWLEGRKGHLCGRGTPGFWSFPEEKLESLCRGRADSPLWGTEELHHPPRG